MSFIDKMTNHYLVTALWSTLDYFEEDECGNSPNLDDTYSIEDISPEFIQKSKDDCQSFYNLTSHLYLDDERDPELIGHNFWLTRNRHGAGFWDGDYIRGREITDILQRHFKENDDELNESIVREV